MPSAGQELNPLTALPSAELPPNRQAAATPLDRLAALVEPDMAAVNRLIVDNMQSDVALIPQLASYIVASGGKRLRPLLTVAAAKLCGYEGPRHSALAACVEFLHTATLLHDDVVDESDMRRGQESANAVFGNKASVLVGDFLFSRAFELMVADGSLEVLRILSHASAVIAEGEVLQLTTTGNLETDREAYTQVIAAKTAALFQAATEIGAVVAGRPAAEQQALATYGYELGIAFQLIDDVLDYSAVQAELGKTVGDDFREGKMTLPVILAYAQAGDDAERAFWVRTMEAHEQQEGDLAEAQALLLRHGALDATVDAARAAAARAAEALSGFDASPVREALADVLKFVTERRY